MPRIRSMQRDPLSFLLEMSERFDKITYFRAGKMPVYVIHHPDGIKHVLQEQPRRYSKDTIQYRSLATITGKGLLTSDGSFWLRQRRLAQPAFAKHRLLELASIVVPATQVMLTRWAEVASARGQLDVDDEMMKVALEVVGKALFGIDLSRDAPLLARAILFALDHVVHRARNIVVAPAFVPTPANLRFRAALRTLDSAVYGFMRERRQTGRLGEDLLGMLLEARDETTGEAMTDVQIRDEILTMLIAGHETVAAALTWSWYLLAQNPDCRRRLHEESVNVLGERDPTGADIERLSYAGQVFSEALRLYPPAWVITRKAIQNDEIFGYPIARGALIIMSPYVIHRLPSFWKDAETFFPGRFEIEAESEQHRYGYIPYGAGPRTCIGNHFAETEAKLILAMVSRQFWLDFVPGKLPAITPLVTLRPLGGLRMHPRQH